MSIYHGYRSGLSSAGAYLISGRPYLTGSGVTGSQEIQISFPSVTKAFTVINRTANDLLIHFDTRTNANVISQHHYMSLPNQHDSYGFDVRCKTVYISNLDQTITGSFELHAELTSIDTKEMHNISGSGINEM